MNILIIGGNSFIGKVLGRYLSKGGHKVYGTFNNQDFATVPCEWLAQRFHYELGGAIPHTMFDTVDLVIHLAHDFRAGASKATIRGTKELYSVGKEMGVARQLFFSSCSARPDALSEYGRTKNTLEEFFIRENALVVRPGLVLGQGGLYKRMVGIIKKLPFIPLPDHGDMVVPVIDEHLLCQALTAIVTAPSQAESLPFNLFHPEQVTLAHLLRTTAQGLGRRPRYIPLPSWLLMMALVIISRLGIPAPISIDNFKGLIMSKSANNASDLETILPDIPPMDLMIRNAAARFLISPADSSS